MNADEQDVRRRNVLRIDSHLCVSVPADIDVCQYVEVKTQFATLSDCCQPILQGALDADEADQLASALRVIADPTRLRLLSLIQSQPGNEACVCNLTGPLG